MKISLTFESLSPALLHELTSGTIIVSVCGDESSETCTDERTEDASEFIKIPGDTCQQIAELRGQVLTLTTRLSSLTDQMVRLVDTVSTMPPNQPPRQSTKGEA